jgi:hypothetical protein
LPPSPIGQTIKDMSEDAVMKEEIASAIEARRELDDDMEPALVEAFVERIERRIGERESAAQEALDHKREHQKEMVLGSMGIAVPLLAIAAIFTGLPGVIAVCAALAIIAIVTSRT